MVMNHEPKTHFCDTINSSKMSSNNASGTCSAGDGGGILRDGRRKGIMYLSEDDDDNNDRNSHPRHKGVSFGQTTTSTIPSHTAEGEGEGEGGGGGGGGYDSDDLYDASAVTGSLPAATSAGAGGGGGGGELDEVSRQQAGVEQARRQRREAKNQTEGELAERADEIDQIEKDDGHSNGSTSSKGGGGSRQHFRGEEDLDRNLSLIDTRRSAESNTATGAYDAGDNAECPVEPFNMKAEREGGEGYFDGDTYVFRRGEGDDGEPDAWLDELATGGSGSGSGPGAAAGGGDNSASSNAAEASIARITGQGRSSKGAAKKAPALDLEGLTDAELCRRIAALLASDDETVARALKRYGDVIARVARDRKRKQKAAKAATRAKKQAGDNGMQQVEVADEVGDDDDQGVQAAQKALSELTELADALLMSGDGEVYGRKRSELVTKSSVGNADDDHVAGQKRKRGYFGEEKDDVPTNKAAKAEESSTAASSKKEAVQWEYKGNQDNQIHGPYTTEQMLGWIQAGYFVGEAAVDVRKVKSASEEAATSPPAAAAATTDDLMADLMDSDDEDNGNSKEAAATAADAQEEWERSDKIDFSVYLR